MVLGLVTFAFGALLTFYAAIRLGIGRHGAAWWRPFQNELTGPHVHNLVTLGLGIVGLAVGVWLVIRAVRSSRRAGTSDLR
jgi:hypothetical protein